MIYDLNDYRRVIKPLVKIWCDRLVYTTPYEEIGAIAVATECPIIAVAHYVGEVYGFTVELNNQIARLEQFYKVDEVKGKLDV